MHEAIASAVMKDDPPAACLISLSILNLIVNDPGGFTARGVAASVIISSLLSQWKVPTSCRIQLCLFLTRDISLVYALSLRLSSFFQANSQLHPFDPDDLIVAVLDIRKCLGECFFTDRLNMLIDGLFKLFVFLARLDHE